MLGVCLLLTVLAGWSVSRAVVATTVGEQLLGDKPEFRSYQRRNAELGNDEVVVVGLEGVDPLAPEELGRLRAAVGAVEALPDVDRVVSVLSVSRVEGEEGTLVVRGYADEVLEHPERREAVRAALRDDPLAGGLALSRDGRCTALVVELTVDPGRPMERVPAVVEAIRQGFVDAGYAPEGVHLAGFQAALAENMRQIEVNVFRILPAVCVVLLLAVWLLFRWLWPAALSLGVALLAVEWTMGLLVAFDPHIHGLLSMAPIVILIVAFSDVVHLCSAYLAEVDAGRDQTEAIVETVRDVGRACLLTSATTFVGFASLVVVPTPVMRSFAFVLGFGVASALLLAVTLAPILFSLLPRPRPLRAGATGRIHEALDGLLRTAERTALRRPWAVVAAFSVLVAWAAWGFPRATLEVDFSARFDEDSRLSVDTRWFADQFSGTNTFDVYVDAPEGEDLLDPTRFARLGAFQDALVALPEVEGATSVVDLVRAAYEAVAPDLARDSPLPNDRRLLAQLLLLFELAGGEDLDRLVDAERTTARLRVRIRDNGTRATAAAGMASQALAARTVTDGTRVEASGLQYLLGYFFEDLFEGQKRAMGLTFLMIALMMAVGIRSLRVGALSMIPNLLPLLVLGGAIGTFYDRVDTDVIIVGITAIGIGVDDTIHFLMRYRIELSRTSDHERAIRGTYSFAGRAIVMTTVILVVGFAPCALSGFVTMRLLGTLLPLCLVVALLADLLLVPALVRLGPMRLAVPRRQEHHK